MHDRDRSGPHKGPHALAAVDDGTGKVRQPPNKAEEPGHLSAVRWGRSSTRSACGRSRTAARVLSGSSRRCWRRLLAEPGCGALTAAILIGHTAGNERFRSEAACARQAGAAPIPLGERERAAVRGVLGARPHQSQIDVAGAVARVGEATVLVSVRSNAGHAGAHLLVRPQMQGRPVEAPIAHVLALQIRRGCAG